MLVSVQSIGKALQQTSHRLCYRRVCNVDCIAGHGRQETHLSWRLLPLVDHIDSQSQAMSYCQRVSFWQQGTKDNVKVQQALTSLNRKAKPMTRGLGGKKFFLPRTMKEPTVRYSPVGAVLETWATQHLLSTRALLLHLCLIHLCLIRLCLIHLCLMHLCLIHLRLDLCQTLRR